MKKLLAIFTIIALIILLSSCVVILSMGLNLPITLVLSKLIIFVGKGLDKVVFSPYILLVLLIIFLIYRTDDVLNLARKLSEIFDEVGGIKFKSNLGPTTTEEIPETIQSSSLESSNKTYKSEVAFYKELLSKNGATAVCRFILYAINQHGRPNNFSLRELVVWTFGEDATQSLEKSNTIRSISYPASLLVQIGAVEGKIVTEPSIHFEDIRVNPNAKKALEELQREGHLMVAQIRYE